jgi:tRNA pseudouridine55 synthase
VERQPRRVQVYALELLSFVPPLVSVRVACSRGTYVRSLADDIGAELGCGAALQELRRTASGPFTGATAVTLEALDEAGRQGRMEVLCMTPYAALGHLEDVPLTDVGLVKVRHGRSPGVEDTRLTGPLTCDRPRLVRLSQGELLAAVAELRPAEGGTVQIVVKRVFN